MKHILKKVYEPPENSSNVNVKEAHRKQEQIIKGNVWPKGSSHAQKLTPKLSANSCAHDTHIKKKKLRLGEENKNQCGPWERSRCAVCVAGAINDLG